MKQEILKYTCLVMLLTVVYASGSATSINEVREFTTTSVDSTRSRISENVELIKTIYSKFVFALDSDGDMSAETYFTDNALKKLQDEYGLDCDNEHCYAYYALRTGAQDSKTGSDGTSTILRIDSDGEGWYVVSFLDMGWPGRTRIRIIDGKVDDYQTIKL